MSDIAKNIKKLRMEKDMTLEELADRVGTTRQTVHKYENEIIKDIPYKRIYAIADALGVTPAQLMGFETPEASATRKPSSSPDIIVRTGEFDFVIENEPFYNLYQRLDINQQKRVMNYMIRLLAEGSDSRWPQNTNNKQMDDGELKYGTEHI